MAGVTALIPAYNEGDRISSTLVSLQKDPRIGNILVVDDGSQDDTAQKAGKLGARVLQLPENRGKGDAITAASPFIEGDIVIILDADLGTSAAEALILLGPVLAGDADITIARFPPGKGGHGFGLAKKTAELAIKVLTGRRLLSPLSGQRCLKKSVLEALLPLAPRFGMEVGMIIDALRKGYRIVEMEADLEHCPPGRNWSGFLHRGRQLCDIFKALASRIWGYKTHS